MNEPYLAHHGILGQKWGVRRFQNADGTRTDAGKKRYRENNSEKKELTTEQKKKIATTALKIGAYTAVAAATFYVARHPEKLENLAIKAMDKLENQMDKAYDAYDNNPVVQRKQQLDKKAERGKKAVQNAFNNPVGKGLKVVGAAALEGATIMAATKALKKAYGDDETDDLMKSYNAYTKKDDRIKYQDVNTAIVKRSQKAAKAYNKKLEKQREKQQG